MNRGLRVVRSWWFAASFLGPLWIQSGCDDSSDGTQFSALIEDLPEALLSVHGTSASDVWAVGADRGNGPRVLHFDGTQWSSFDTNSGAGGIWWVHALRTDLVYFGGEGGLILRYDGSSFEVMDTPAVSTHTVYGIWARTEDELYAVGSLAGGRDGFLWRYRGSEWTEVRLPSTLPKDSRGSIPGFFKVWGTDDTLYIVGSSGLVLRLVEDSFTVVESGETGTLFTVHGGAEGFVAVGGGVSGAIFDIDDATLSSQLSGAVPLLQGVWLDDEGGGWASGASGSMYRRNPSGIWIEEARAIPLSVESLHAVWVDPDGGVWSVGGNVLSTDLDHGVLIHRGPVTAQFRLEPDALDGGVDAGDEVVCPAEDVDPKPSGSIARRWNEAVMGAIRRSIPRPTVHARNLLHISIALYDAFGAYDADVTPYLVTEERVGTKAEQANAMSYAAYRVAVQRYAQEAGGDVSVACFAALMAQLGLDPNEETTEGNGPAAVGNRIAGEVLATYANDGSFQERDYQPKQAYAALNPSLIVDLAGTGADDPERWQPLNLSVAVTQNGIVEEAGVQRYIGPHWGLVTPFALQREQPETSYFDLGAGPLFDETTVAEAVELVRLSSLLDPRLPQTINLSPRVFGNNSLGTNDGTGHGNNPVTGEAYADNLVSLADFGRLISEIWADGPNSETPPGHWNVIANQVFDSPDFSFQLFGSGPALDRLEWDVKLYLVLNGALHDAAIAAWEAKRTYESSRPITLIRYMAERGQRSDPSGQSYHAEGIPLVDGLIELITEESAAPGGRHEHLSPYIGQIALRSWRGEPRDRDNVASGVAWIRGAEWLPYQRRTFVSPAFPGYVSGHSTFSRAAARVLAEVTGSPYFPSGYYEIPLAPGYLVFEAGPTTEVGLTYASYYDAADQAGLSRLYGGIHIEADDLDGRIIGDEVGRLAVEEARPYLLDLLGE